MATVRDVNNYFMSNSNKHRNERRFIRFSVSQFFLGTYERLWTLEGPIIKRTHLKAGCCNLIANF
jgi:hypothetical protein